ncbi:hypothetical protein E2C01_041676 [Portunus trituberculatus]|uniref:Uncharacterized protein n=1 Tax=Portunus trituberculatus TaxID=210409 RepID=A0A5B7FRA6_PORTR|nr:hypothetical protein [Portunus trituberculatus]
MTAKEEVGGRDADTIHTHLWMPDVKEDDMNDDVDNNDINVPLPDIPGVGHAFAEQLASTQSRYVTLL